MSNLIDKIGDKKKKDVGKPMEGYSNVEMKSV